MSYGVAVLGIGRIGGRYLDIAAQNDNTHPVVVAEPRAEQVTELRERFPKVDFVTGYEAALNRDDVDIAVVTLPHWLHKDASLYAARNGIHVYTEKPLAVWAAEGREMLNTAKENGVKLMTAHTQRYYPVVRKAKAIVESGELGELLMLYDVWYKPYGPYQRPSWMLDRATGGGMGQMDGTHQIDRALWFAGNDVGSVSAIVGQWTYPRSTHPDIRCDDTSMVFLRWNSGVAGTLSRIAWESGGLDYGTDLFLTKGMLRLKIQYGKSSPPTGVWIADTPNGTWRQVDYDDSDALFDEFSDFVSALKRGDKDTPIPQRHGQQVLEILEATEKSAETGREIQVG